MFMCLLLQYLLQSCSRGGEGVEFGMCSPKRFGLWRGPNRPVVNLCSPYPRLFFFGITSMLGVDSCVFLTFTTRVGLKTRLNGVNSIRFEQCRIRLRFVFEKNRFPGDPQKHFMNSSRFGPLGLCENLW